jgi:hypothetical protein
MSTIEFPGYHLKKNPFVWEKNLYTEYDQEVELEKFFYQKVINYLWDVVVKRWESGNLQPFWVWHDDIGLEHRIGVYGGLLRTMFLSEYPKVFSVDVPITFPKGNFLRDVYRLFLSKLNEERLKTIFYTFLKDSLEKDTVYVGKENEEKLLKGVEEEGFEYFEKITLGEEKDEEITEELVQLAKAYLKEIKAGPALERVAEIFLRLGSKGVMNSLIPVNPVEDLSGLINFLKSYYDLVVIFLDNMEFLELREPPNKADIMGGISQLEILAEGIAMLIFVSQSVVKEILGKKMASKYEQFSYKLNLSSYQKDELTKEEVKKLLVEFLSSDKNWLEKKDNSFEAWPFEDSTLEDIHRETGGSPIKVLEMASKLLHEGKARGYPVIDKKLVEEVFSKKS